MFIRLKVIVHFVPFIFILVKSGIIKQISAPKYLDSLINLVLFYLISDS